MIENPSTQFENKNDEREQEIKEIIALATELRESQEVFPFPGINSEAYSIIKSYEEKFPGYVTPIDELVERFEREGIKVALGVSPENEDVFILPAQSDDLRNDSILLNNLQINEAMDERLKKLILANKGAAQNETKKQEMEINEQPRSIELKELVNSGEVRLNYQDVDYQTARTLYQYLLSHLDVKTIDMGGIFARSGFEDDNLIQLLRERNIVIKNYYGVGHYLVGGGVKVEFCIPPTKKLELS